MPTEVYVEEGMSVVCCDLVELKEGGDTVDIRKLMEDAVEKLLPISELPAQYECKGCPADRCDREQLLA